MARDFPFDLPVIVFHPNAEPLARSIRLRELEMGNPRIPISSRTENNALLALVQPYRALGLAAAGAVGAARALGARAVADLGLPSVAALAFPPGFLARRRQHLAGSQAPVDLLHLIKQFSQGQSCLPELHRAHVAQRRMDPLLVVPPHIRVELAAELVEAGECPPVDELPLQDLVGGLDDGAVVRVALAGEGPSDAERLQQLVHAGVRELAGAFRVERADVRQREPQRGEGGLHQPGSLPLARRVPHDLAVAQVDQQADVVPPAADADVREVADYVGAREPAVELPVEHVGDLGLVHLGGGWPVLLAGADADQAFLAHYPLYAPPGGDHALLGERALYLRAPYSRRFAS